MPGFFISNRDCDCQINNFYNDCCNREKISDCGFVIQRNTLNKLLDDKIFQQNEHYIVITEGVILNRTTLMKKYGKTDFFETVISMYETCGEDFFKDFRGSFSGAIYLKSNKKWIIFTNHVGDKQVFYYINGEDFAVGSEVNYLVEWMKKSGIQYHMDETGIYFQLTYGFMGDSNTLIQEVKKLQAGTYLVIKDGKYEIKTYHRFRYNKYDLSALREDEIIEGIDQRFRKAVRLEFEKDKEYGYRHFGELSGGLDSRMTLWVANDLGYRNITAATYCKSGYIDEKIAEQIACHCGFQWIFKSLDDASMMFDVDKITKMSFGLDYYLGMAHSNSLYEHLNLKDIGLCHTGQLGDVIVGGTYAFYPYPVKNFDVHKAYSNMLISRVDRSHLRQYDWLELYCLYVRGFLGTLNSHAMRQNYFEIVSPFLDIDFIEYCLSIPLNMRFQHNIYKKWIVKKYPDAAQFKWETINAKITDSKLKVALIHIIRRGPAKLTKMLGIKSDLTLPVNMNPYDLWYFHKAQVKEFMDSYFADNIETYGMGAQLLEDMKMMYTRGNATEKAQVLSVLSALKLYFDKKNG